MASSLTPLQLRELIPQQVGIVLCGRRLTSEPRGLLLGGGRAPASGLQLVAQQFGVVALTRRQKEDAEQRNA